MPCAMLSERKQCYYRTSSDDNRSTVPAMAEVEFSEWSKQQPQHTAHIAADVSEKLADLKMGDPADPPAAYIAQKRPSIVENVFNVVSNLITMASRYGNKPDVQSTSLHRSAEKGEYLVKPCIPSTPCIPIFETNKNGKGQLTVPLDYSCTVDDIAMTPAGVYVEQLARCDRPRRVRKRRKDPSKANQHTHLAAGDASGKGCGKNRKEKKRHALRRDILNDNQALSIDDCCYGYDYRDAMYDNAMETQSLPQRCLLAGFSPSSTGSVGSFQDALQDIVPLESLHLRASSDNVRAVPVPPGNTQQKHHQPAKQSPASTASGTVNTIADQEQQKCDIDPSRAEFVVFTDYDVFMTPSASPARRQRPRNLCEAFSYVWHGDGEDEEDEQSDYTSDGITEEDGEDGNSLDGGDGFEDYDDDDDSIVFCEDYDDLNDDSNSSSGFEEKKVRFNLKPVVHVMRAWDFAYRQARKGDWEMAARDSERFRKRITDLEPVLGPALQPALRDKIYAERFSGEPKEQTRKILH